MCSVCFRFLIPNISKILIRKLRKESVFNYPVHEFSSRMRISKSFANTNKQSEAT